MLVLFDSPAGHCLFKVLDPGILKKPDSIWDAFTSADSAKKMCAPPPSRAWRGVRTQRGTERAQGEAEGLP